MIITIIQALLLLFTIWMAVSVIYILIYSLSGHFYKNTVVIKREYLPSIAVFIPAYKEDEVIIDVVRESTLQHYNGKYDVYVIADTLKDTTIKKLEKFPIHLIEVNFKKSTKTKAINVALEKINIEYDLAIILDADNVMDKNALTYFASEYLNGHHAIQGRRCAKNKETQFALLDALSEEVNNHIYCKGPSAINLSSRLVGSGMAFDFNLFKRLMKTINAVGGFDKELELKIIKEGIKIKYVDSAVIFDEKVSKSEVFENQRRRWISAQYHYMIKAMPIAFLELLKGNFDYFYKALQLTLPPRLLLPVILFFFCCIFYLFNLKNLSTTWLILFILNVIAYSISIPLKFWNKELLSGVHALPSAFLATLKALISIGGANKKFIHTPHTKK